MDKCTKGEKVCKSLSEALNFLDKLLEYFSVYEFNMTSSS